jgi:hypothetical protein
VQRCSEERATVQEGQSDREKQRKQERQERRETQEATRHNMPKKIIKLFEDLETRKLREQGQKKSPSWKAQLYQNYPDICYNMGFSSITPEWTKEGETETGETQG